MTPVRRVTCPYCGARAILRREAGPRYRWECEPCDARVGCHRDTTRPLGRLADAATREARIRAHAAFDPLWQRAMATRGWSRATARTRAYEWLARMMHIPVSRAHIALFDVDECERVVALCRQRRHTTHRTPTEA